MKKKVLLVGGRSKAKSLALSLLHKGYQVTAINDTYEDCVKLSEIEGLSVLYGDGTRPFLLEDAGAFEADIVIALTAKDEDNLVICELSKKRFHVPRTVAIVTDPKKTDFFYQMGIDRVVCAITTITNIIEQQAFVDHMTNVIPIAEGPIRIAEIPVCENAPIAGKKLWEVNLPQDVIIGSVLRGDRVMVPRGDTRILAGDMLVLISGNGTEISQIEEWTGREAK
ncbi:MAG: TrkA family potassium uptake protein [Clostridiales bacterium]|nr:TrkA family potassium uptake protein [Clostridiales bacterium]